jgi:hypothetical protein
MFEYTQKRWIHFAILGAAVAAVLASTGCVAYHYPGGPSYYTTAAPPRVAAHGYTHRYGDVDLVFDGSWNGYWVRSHPDHYFYANYYYRRHGSGWQRARSMRGPWLSVEVRALPTGLQRHATAKPRRDDRRESALERRDEFRAAVKENRAQKVQTVKQRRDELRGAVKENRAQKLQAVKENRAQKLQAVKENRAQKLQAVKENRAQKLQALTQRSADQRQAVRKRVEERREVAQSRSPRQVTKTSAGDARRSAERRGQKSREDDDEEHPASHRAR